MIRPAVPDDISPLIEMIRDLAEFERALDQVEIDKNLLKEALFGKEPSLFARVADVDDVIAGMALYFRSFSTWTGHTGIYLEDLYVRPEYRRQGIGRDLLAALAEAAVEQGCRRLEWSVLDWNERAITFYRSIGAVPMDEWTRYRLAGLSLQEFAKSSRT